MLYHQAIQLHTTLNQLNFPNCLKHLTIIDQTICTSRQLKFRVYKTNTHKIGMNMTANKFFLYLRPNRTKLAKSKLCTF